MPFGPQELSSTIDSAGGRILRSPDRMGSVVLTALKESSLNIAICRGMIRVAGTP